MTRGHVPTKWKKKKSLGTYLINKLTKNIFFCILCCPISQFLHQFKMCCICFSHVKEILSLHDCYRMNYALHPIFVCWSTNPQYLRMWLYLKIDPSKRQLSYDGIIKLGLIQYDWCPNKRQDKEKMTIYQPRREVSEGTSDLRLLAFRNVQKINFFCLRHTVYALCYGSPTKQMQQFSGHNFVEVSPKI